MNENDTVLVVQDVVLNTKQLLGSVRQNLIKVAANLHFLHAHEELWDTSDKNGFGKYAQEEFGILPSMSTKLVKSYEGWVVGAGISPDKLEGIDHDKLYNYLPLLAGKDPELALSEVSTWSRADIKDEKQEKTPCSHENHGDCCYDCWTKL